jgi:twitching motility protein PilJ
MPATVGGDSSISSESAPTDVPSDFNDTRVQGEPLADTRGSGLPLIGHLAAGDQQRVLGGMLFVGLIGLLAVSISSYNAADRSASQVAASGDALMQSRRLAKSATQALVGSSASFAEVKESVGALTASVRGLQEGSDTVARAPGSVQPALEPIGKLVAAAEKNAGIVLAQQQQLTQVTQALRGINRQSSDLLEIAETVSTLKLQQDATPAELSAVGQAVMLTQRIGKSANEFLTVEGVSPEAVFLLGKDLNSFREIVQGLLDGNSELRLAGTRDAATRERLQQLVTQYEKTRNDAGAILNNLQGLVAARSR